MRVLHIAQTLSKKYGGVQTLLPELGHFQALAGFEVDVAATNVDAPSGVVDVPTDRPFTVDDVTFHCFPVQFRALLYSTQFKKYLDREISRFDIVHIHGLYRFPMTYTAFRCRKRGIPYIISPHGSLDPYLYAKSSRSVPLKRLYEQWFDLPNLNAAGGIHYTAEEERDRAAFLGLQAPAFVVPNGIDWRRYVELPPRGAFRAAHGLGDTPLVLFLGRLHLKKGLDLLVPAFDLLLRHCPTARLVIAGTAHDDYGEKVRNWVQSRGLTEQVLFVGHIDGEAVTQAYVDADVFALPSYTENFGMTVVEAMACGLPVVISDQVNIHSDITASGSGLVTRCDVDETADALKALLADTDRRRIMGLNARAAAKSLYGWPAIVDALRLEYEATVERTRTAPPLAAQRDGDGQVSHFFRPDPPSTKIGTILNMPTTDLRRNNRR